jgi:hypothetical protein
MSVPLSIQFRAVEAPQLQQTPHTGIYGTSPGSASTGKHQSGGSQARKLCKRIQWDSSLDEKEWTVRCAWCSIGSILPRYSPTAHGRSIQRASGWHPLQMVGSTTVPTVDMDRLLGPAIMSAEAIVYVCIHMHIPYRTAVDGPLCHCVQLSTGHAHVALYSCAHLSWGVIQSLVLQHLLQQ